MKHRPEDKTALQSSFEVTQSHEVTLKSKPDRVLQLKKKVARYLFRGQTTVQNQIPTVNDVSMAGPDSDDDSSHQSDHNDDLA